jgi:hypothetical protein
MRASINSTRSAKHEYTGRVTFIRSAMAAMVTAAIPFSMAMASAVSSTCGGGVRARGAVPAVVAARPTRYP